MIVLRNEAIVVHNTAGNGSPSHRAARNDWLLVE
jgi:hypothetical protein